MTRLNAFLGAMDAKRIRRRDHTVYILMLFNAALWSWIIGQLLLIAAS